MFRYLIINISYHHTSHTSLKHKSNTKKKLVEALYSKRCNNNSRLRKHNCSGNENEKKKVLFILKIILNTGVFVVVVGYAG